MSLKYSRHFWMCFLSSHAVSVNGALTIMNQLIDIRNKLAESLKTNNKKNNNKKKIFSDYVVCIGALN